MKPVSDKRKAKLQAQGWDGRTSFASSHSQRTLQNAKLKRTRKPWKAPLTHEWSAKAKHHLKAIGKRAKAVLSADIAWRNAVHSVWGCCIVTGATEGLNAHHAYAKQAHPEWRHELWNGLTLRGDIHSLLHSLNGGMAAGQAVADEVRAAAEGRRPPVSNDEARQILLRECPKLRKYAKGV